MSNNFCASWLCFRNKRIFDEQGNPISTIEYTDEIYPLRYKRPTLVYDFLENLPQDKKESIVEITYKKLISMGYSLYGFYPPKSWGWKPAMKRIAIIKNGSPEERYGTRKRSQDGHKILFDEANLRVKIVGPRSSPSGFGEWVIL